MADFEFNPMDALGTTGLKHHSGIMNEEFMHRLRGQNAIRLYREMISNSPTIAAALNAIKMLIGQVEWRVEPADESDAAAAEAEETQDALDDMSGTFEEFVKEALSMIWAGYAPFEIVYKLRRGPDQEDGGLRSKFNDGKFGWRRVEIRGQETIDRWVFDDDGGLQGVVQMDVHALGGRGRVFIPIDKMLLFRIETFKGNPEGQSLIRPAVIPYWFTKRIQEFEAIGIERNLAGMPIMEVPPELLSAGATPEMKAAKAALERFITQVRMDERWGGLVPSEVKPDGSPSGFKFKLMQSSGRKLVDTDVIIKRYRGEMLMIFMAQFLVMGTEKVGSFSLASNATDLFGTALGTIMDSIADIVNRFLIPRRQRLNGRPIDLDPKLVHGDIEGPELDKLASYISSLSSAGLISANPALERKLLEMGSLPQPPDDEELMFEVRQPEPGEEAAESSLPEGDSAEPKANEALNGAQVKALTDILLQVAQGLIPGATAAEVIAASFPIPREKIGAMLKPVVDKLLRDGPVSAAPSVPAKPAPPVPDPASVPDEDEGEVE